MLKVLAERFSREAFWVVIGQGSAVFAGIFGVRVLTQILSPASYGELAIGMTVGILIHQTIMGPIINSSVRYYSVSIEHKQVDDYFRAVIKIYLLAVVCILVVTLSLVAILSAFSIRTWIPLCFSTILYTLFSSTNNLLDGLQNAARQRKIVALHQSLAQIVRFSMAYIAVFLFGNSSFIAMSGFALGAGFVVCSQLFFLRKTIQGPFLDVQMQLPDQETNWTKRLFDFGWPFSSYGLITWLHMSSDRWLLARYSTMEHVGYYSVLFQLGYFPLSLLTDMIMQLISPILYARSGDATDSARVRAVHRINTQLTAMAFGLTILVVIIAAISHSTIFNFLVAPDYRHMSYLWPWMILAGGLFATGQTAVLSIQSSTNTRSLIAPKIITAIVGMMLNFVGVLLFGLEGVVYALVCFALLYAGWAFILLMCSTQKQDYTCQKPQVL